jgi:hypothetical protein
MAEAVAGLLHRSLTDLASEVPASCRHLHRTLGALVIEVEVDGELFALRGVPELEVVDVVDGTVPDVRVTTSRAAILDVLDGTVALREAVESGRVAVRGALDDVVRAHATLIAYVHAALRAPSARGLLADLRAPSGGTR